MAVVVTAVVAMATMPMEEVATAATTVAMGAKPQATMATVAMEAMLMAVSVHCTLYIGMPLLVPLQC